MDFETIIRKLIDQNIRLNIHYAVVTDIEDDNGTYYLTIKLAGADDEINKVRYLKSYVPRINDVVTVLVNKADIIVLGSLTLAGMTIAPTAYRTSVLTINRFVEEFIPFQAVTSDEWGMWDSGDATKLTCKVPGRYMATFQILCESESNNDVRLKVWKNNETVGSQNVVTRSNADGFHGMITTVPFTLAIGDYVRGSFYHINNPDLDLLITAHTVDHTGYFNALGVVYLGP
jgi:hypothetical protein